jgi:hypothetical protein
MTTSSNDNIIENIPQKEPSIKDAGPVTDGGPSARFTNFAQESTISQSNNRLHGRWSPSFGGACADGVYSYIEIGSIVSSVWVGTCSGSGERVLKVEHF